MTRQVLQDRLALRSEENYRNLFLVPALEAGLLEMTIPHSPWSRLQKYRLTARGQATRVTPEPKDRTR